MSYLMHTMKETLKYRISSEGNIVQYVTFSVPFWIVDALFFCHICQPCRNLRKWGFINLSRL